LTTITVHNAGNYTLTLSNPAFVDATHFGAVTAFPIGIGANQTKPIVLSCTPTNVNQVSTSLSFNTTDPDRTSVAYTLICNGTPAPAPSFSAIPALGPIEFGEVTTGRW
jgi:hypothetical protein